MTQTIAWTGHRTKDLPQDASYAAFASALKDLGVHERRDIEFITGGALGVDTWAAQFAIDYDIPLHIHLPFTPAVMGKFWPDYAKQVLAMHLNCAESVTLVGGDQYRIEDYQRRNESMVDAADHVFTVWTGKPSGGTANCIRYALKSGKAVYNLLPFNGKLRPVKEVA